MAYCSSLTDKEWELIEPLLPHKKKTRPPRWSKRQILDGIFYQLKNGCNWCDLPKDLPPYSTVFWHYKQWRSDGVLECIMSALHEQVRQQVKKNQSGPAYSSSTRKRWKTPVMPVLNPKGFVITSAPTVLSDILPSILWDCRFLPIARKRMSLMTRGWLKCWAATKTTFVLSRSISQRLPFCLTTDITQLRLFKPCNKSIPRLWRRFALNWHPSPRQPKKQLKGKWDLFQWRLGGWLNGRMLGWSVVRAWSKTLKERWVMPQLSSICVSSGWCSNG